MAESVVPTTRATYCVADVWNGNLTWNTEHPDFTPCFHKTILVFVPCGFLWLLAPLEYMSNKRHPARTVPTSWLFLAKLAATAVLVAIAAAELGNDIWLQGGLVGKESIGNIFKDQFDYYVI